MCVLLRGQLVCEHGILRVDMTIGQASKRMCVRVLREIAVVGGGNTIFSTYVIIVITSEGNCTSMCVCVCVCDRVRPSFYTHTHTDMNSSSAVEIDRYFPAGHKTDGRTMIIMRNETEMVEMCIIIITIITPNERRCAEQ